MPRPLAARARVEQTGSEQKVDTGDGYRQGRKQMQQKTEETKDRNHMPLLENWQTTVTRTTATVPAQETRHEDEVRKKLDRGRERRYKIALKKN